MTVMIVVLSLTVKFTQTFLPDIVVAIQTVMMAVVFSLAIKLSQALLPYIIIAVDTVMAGIITCTTVFSLTATVAVMAIIITYTVKFT